MESGRTIEIPIDPIKHDYYIYYNKVGIIQGIYKELCEKQLIKKI